MEWNIDDLFKKEPPMLHYAGIRPSSRRTSTPRRQKKKSPRPDDPKSSTSPRPDDPRSSSALLTSPPIITRVVRGVVDLVSSDDDEETVLEESLLLPETVEFDYHYAESEDSETDDDESNGGDDKSENLLEE